MKDTKFLIILCLLCGLLVAQDGDQPSKLELQQIQKVTLDASVHKKYQIIIPDDLNKEESLFVEAQSQFNDPYSMPFMNISAGDGDFSQACFQENNDYSDICEITNDRLSSKQKIYIDVSCMVECTFEIFTYLDQNIQMQLSKKYQITSSKEIASSQTLSFKVPEEQFTEIFIIAQFINADKVVEGLEIYANYGREVDIPSQNQFMIESSPFYNHMVAISLSKDDVEYGDEIKLLLVMGKNMQIRTWVQISKGNQHNLFLGKAFIGVSSDQEDKIFTLDVGRQITVQETDTIQITVLIYSGNPEVTVNFDPDFPKQKQLNNNFIERKMSFLITGKIRQQFGYDGKVYIKVHSYWNSAFYIKAAVNQKQFIDIDNGIMEMTKLGPHQLRNFIFEDKNIGNTDYPDGQLAINYKVTIQMIDGSAEIDIRPCKSLQQSNTLDCLVKSFQQLKNQANQNFNEIKVSFKRYFNTYYLYFNYNVGQCPSFDRENGQKVYVCEYQLVFANLNKNYDLYAGVQIEKRTTSKYLVEGQIVKDSIDREQYNYYAFTIIKPEQIEKASIFVTLIEGDTGILISKDVHYPEMNDYIEKNANLSLDNSVILTDLTSRTYYVSVYGYEVSDYTISLIFQRKQSANENEITQQNDTNSHHSNKAKTTKITLNKGDVQSYNLDGKNSEEFIFKIISDKSEKVMIQVYPLKGIVSYIVRNKDSNEVICNSSTFNNPNQICRFESIEGNTYQIYVTAPQDSSCVFTISYWTSSVCPLYPKQVPFLVIVEQSYSSCLSFIRTTKEDLQISISMSTYDLINSNISMNAIFPAKVVHIKDHERVFNEDELDLLCNEEGSDKKTQQCEFKLYFNNNNANNQQGLAVMGAVQSVNQETILFQGITEKITSKQMSQQKPKTFYYYLQTPVTEQQKIPNAIITLNSKTQAKYQVSATIISETEFSVDFSDQLYPKYSRQGSSKISINSSEYSPVTVLSLNPNKIIKDFMPAQIYLLLISVFPLEKEVQEQIFIFEIQVSQTETVLEFGDSKIGYLEKDQFFTYVISPDPRVPSMVSVRSLNERSCVQTYEVVSRISQPTSFDKILTLKQQTGKLFILVRGKGQNLCTYQIEFKSLSNPITSVKTGIPYEVSLNRESSVAFYLYQHKGSEIFSILPVISNGDAKLYATILTQDYTVVNLMQKNLDLYQYQSEKNEVLEIDAPSCQKCLFFIAVKGQPIAHLDLLVNKNSSPIPLKQSAYLKSKLEKGAVNIYQFYSITTFNVTVRVLHGEIKIQIANPKGQKVSEQSIKNHKTIIVPKPPNAEDITTDYFNQDSRFTVQIEALQVSEYFISIQKTPAQLKVIEGLPVIIHLSKNAPTTIVIDSIDDSSPLHALIEDMNYTQYKKTTLNFQIETQDEESSNNKILQDKQKIEGSYNLQLKSFKGTCLMTITSDTDVTIQLVIAKKEFTHLLSGSSILMKNSGIFQIFSPGFSVMIETFVCQGDISVTASTNITELLEDDQNGKGVIHMEHANYGGHYVVVANNLSGEYFVKIDQESEEDNLLYSAGYYIFDSAKEKIPYKIFHISNLQIEHRYHQGTIELLLNPVARRDNKEVTEQVEYVLYIAETAEKIQNITRCSLGTTYTLIQNSKNISLKHQEQKVSFHLEHQSVRDLVKNGKSFYVGAEAKVQLKNPQYLHPEAAYFVYDISQLLLNNSPQFSKDNQNLKFVVVWIVIPFLIGSILLYLAARFCIRSFTTSYPSQLIEQQIEYGQSQEAIHNQNHQAQQS